MARRPSAGRKKIAEPAKLHVTVVGGGLAGQVAALKLVQHGVHVTLYERSNRLGGKAGSDATPSVYDGSLNHLGNRALPGGVSSDHGYHVFPKWYVCMRALWQEIGLDPAQDIAEGADYQLLPKARRGVRQKFKNEPRDRDLRRFAAIFDLVNTAGNELKDVTLQAFLYSRQYNDLDNPISLNDYVLNALTIGDSDLSSRTVRTVFWQWFPVFFQKNWDGLRGSLDELLIQRIRQATVVAARQAGVRYRERLQHELVALDIRRGELALQIKNLDTDKVENIRDQPVVLAIPLNELRQLDSVALAEQTSEISNLHSLRANTFSAIDIFFSERLKDFGEKEHFTLEVEPQDRFGPHDFGLTAYDISMHWPALINEDKTVVQFVAANSRSFLSLSEPGFVRAIVREIGRYIPEVNSKVDYFVPHQNLEAPLFVNEVGARKYRPNPSSTEVSNLYFAGDFTLHDTDVASMEGAVRSGMNAAKVLMKEQKVRGSFTIPAALQKPPEFDAFALAPEALAHMQFVNWLLSGGAPPTARSG